MKTVQIIHKQYVKEKENSYFIKESRISLYSVVNAFLNGVSPEGIVQSFPVLSLEQVYGAITFYLANQEVIDLYLQEGKAEYEKLRLRSRQENQAFHDKLIAAKSMIL